LLPMLLFHVWYIDTDDCYQCFCSMYDTLIQMIVTNAFVSFMISIYDTYYWYWNIPKYFFLGDSSEEEEEDAAKPILAMYQNNKYAGLSAYKKKKMIEAEMMDPALTNVPQLLDPSGASAAELSRYGRLQCLLNVRKNWCTFGVSWSFFSFFHFFWFFQQNTVVRPSMFGKNVRWCFGEISAGQQHSHWKKSNQVHPRHRYWYLASNTNLHLCHMLCHLWYFFWTTIVIFFWQLPFRFFLRSPLVPLCCATCDIFFEQLWYFFDVIFFHNCCAGFCLRSRIKIAHAA
jgi:hypothetical protein